MVHTPHTHTCSLHARSVMLNLSIAHALAFYFIELVICMYERPLILFSISVLWLGFCTCSALSIHSWCWQLLSCMWSSLMTGALYIPCNMRLTTTFTEKECNSAFHSFSSLFMPRPLSFCSGHFFRQYTRLALCTNAPCIDWPSYQGRVALVKTLIVGYGATCR